MKLHKSFLFKGSMILFISNIAMRGLDFLYRVLMGRMLIPYDYGLLNLAIPLQFMIILIASAGIAPSIARFISKFKVKNDKKKVNEVVSSAVFYYGLLGLLLGGVFVLLSRPIAIYLFNVEELIPVLVMAALAIPVTMFVSIFTGTFQGFKKMHYMSYSLVFGQTFRLILAIILVSIGWKAFGAMASSLIGFLVAIPLIVWLYRRLKIKYTKASFSTFKEILCFSVPVMITALSMFLLAFTDVFFIGVLLDPIKVGIYSAASPIARLPGAFAVAIATTLLPMISESHENNDNKMKAHVNESLKLLGLIVVPLAALLIIFSERVILLLFGSNYASAAEPLRILTIGMAFICIFITSCGLFQGMGKPRIPMYMLLFIVILNFALNAYLIPIQGINGAALATTISSTVAGLGALVLMKVYVIVNDISI